MPLIKTMAKGAAGLLCAATLTSAPAFAGQSLTVENTSSAASVIGGVIRSVGLAEAAGADIARLFSTEAQRGDRGDHEGRRGHRGGERRSGARSGGDESRGARRPPQRDSRDTGRRAGDAGDRERSDTRSGRRDHADRRSGGDHQSGQHSGGDHQSGQRTGGDHRGDRYADRRGDHRSRGDRHDYRGDHRRDRYSDRRQEHRGDHRSSRHDYRGDHYSGHRGGHQSYGYYHGRGPHRGHGYYCNTHFVFHYFAGFDPVGWYFAFHDGYYPPDGCRTIERIRYRHGRRIVYGAVQCWDSWGYPYILRGSEYVYRSY